jgi:hypothetical protein
LAELDMFAIDENFQNRWIFSIPPECVVESDGKSIHIEVDLQIIFRAGVKKDVPKEATDPAAYFVEFEGGDQFPFVTLASSLHALKATN